MKVTLKIVALAAAVIILGTASEARSVPTVSGVTMMQREGTRLVDISYTLTGEDAIVTLSIETNNVAIPDSNVTRLTGDVCKKVAVGTGRTITWNAGADWPDNTADIATARVIAWCVNAPPQCCVVDLRGGALADAYPVNYYASVEALPFGGLSNVIYKSSYLVMRKIGKGAFNLSEGVPPVAVTLTQDFYAGVFQVTQGQWYNVMGATPANFNDTLSRMYRPVEKVSYHDIRESPDTNTPLVPNWPQSDAVGPNSFMGMLRLKTGLAEFDLPTEAQWEYACRAGTATYYNDGFGTPVNTTSNAQMEVLGRYLWNGGKPDGTGTPDPNCGPENGTAIVGSHLPNEWGLYDMHGNVWEWCLDWFASTLSGGTDPSGADSSSGSGRVRRGGAWDSPAFYCRSASRYDYSPASRIAVFGFRVVRTLH